MNSGKRLIRNSVFTLWGVAVAFVGLNRIYASTDANTAPALRAALRLGLQPAESPQPRPEIDLATVRDFTRLSLYGRMNVEVIGAADYKVEYIPDPGHDEKVRAYISLEDSTLHVVGLTRGRGESSADTGAVGTLRIEVPTLTRIDANVPQLSVSTLTAPELRLTGFRMTALLLQNEVKNWRMFGSPMEVRMDDATFAAGGIKTNGDVLIRRAN